MENIHVSRTKAKQAPALWENGGGMSNTGYAVLVALPDGGKPVATYIRMRGQLACSDHALVVIRPGMYVVKASHHHGDFHIRIYRLVNVPREGDSAPACTSSTRASGTEMSPSPSTAWWVPRSRRLGPTTAAAQCGLSPRLAGASPRPRSGVMQTSPQQISRGLGSR